MGEYVPQPNNRFFFRPRKVWQMNGSMVCTLPAEWLQNLDVQSGERLTASMDSERRLILEPAEERTNDREDG